MKVQVITEAQEGRFGPQQKLAIYYPERALPVEAELRLQDRQGNRTQPLPKGEYVLDLESCVYPGRYGSPMVAIRPSALKPAGK